MEDHVAGGHVKTSPSTKWVKKKRRMWHNVPHFVPASPRKQGVFTGLAAKSIQYMFHEGSNILFTSKGPTWHNYYYDRNPRRDDRVRTPRRLGPSKFRYYSKRVSKSTQRRRQDGGKILGVLNWKYGKFLTKIFDSRKEIIKSNIKRDIHGIN